MQSIQAVQKLISTKFLATRRGTILLGFAAAALAAVVLLAYLNQYRDSVGSGSTPVSVLVASRLIEVGTPGDAIAGQGHVELAPTAEESVKAGALTDPAALKGMVAISEVYPGQQLTISDFQAVGVSGVGAQLKRGQRAVAIPIDTHRGLVGRLQVGDRVDVYAAVNGVIKLMLQDIYVIEPPGGSGGGITGGSESNVLLRVDSEQAAKLAWVTENGKPWIVLRPRLGAKKVAPKITNVNAVLASGR